MYGTSIKADLPSILMPKLTRKKILLTFLLAMLFGGLSLVDVGEPWGDPNPLMLKLRYALVGISLISLLLISFWNQQSFKSCSFDAKALPLLSIWILFSLVSVFSGLVNNDSVSVREGFWFLYAIPVIWLFVIPNLIKDNANFLIANSLFLGNLPYLITSLFLDKPNKFQYLGVFRNPNQMGLVCASLTAGILVVLAGIFSANKKTSNTAIFIALLILVLAIVMLSSSRTSILACICMLLIFFSKSLRYFKDLLKIFFITIAIISVFSFYQSERLKFILSVISAGILSKIGGSAGVFSGREYIWQKTIEDMNLLGNSSNYFEFNFSFSAHNTVIHILGVNGIIAMELIVLFAIASFFYTYRYFRIYGQKDSFAMAPLILTTCFWILSMGEMMFGSLGKSITFAYLLSVGVVMTKPRVTGKTKLKTLAK